MCSADELYQSRAQTPQYEYIVMDDCWQLVNRDTNGNVIPNLTTFPKGIKPVENGGRKVR
jgi:alpha-galactosidase